MPEAYEKLIHDVLQGESHNFVRRDELEQAWCTYYGYTSYGSTYSRDELEQAGRISAPLLQH